MSTAVLQSAAAPGPTTGMLVVFGVVALALFVTEALPVDVTAILLMVSLGVLRPEELYDTVEWNVVFLLAGVIPLGIALQRTGGAALLGHYVAETATYLPPVGVLWAFYVVTGLVTELVSNNASVVLMLPVAVTAAVELGASPFAFVIAVTFAASTSFMTPVGYQTNLFVYGPGGTRSATTPASARRSSCSSRWSPSAVSSRSGRSDRDDSWDGADTMILTPVPDNGR